MIERVRPPALRNVTEERIRVEPSLMNNIRLFTKRLKADTRECRAFGQQTNWTQRQTSGLSFCAEVGTSVAVYKTGHSASSKNEKNKIRLRRCQTSGSSLGATTKSVVGHYPPHKEKCITHMLEDCPEKEKPKLLQSILDEKKTGVKKIATLAKRRETTEKNETTIVNLIFTCI